jgi:transposase
VQIAAMEISDAQWALIEKDLKHPREGKPSRGRPPVPARKILEGVLWILRTGAQWVELPRRYPPYQTVHRRYQEWNINGQLTKALKTLARHLEKEGKLDLSECAIDGTFAAAKKKACALVRQSEEKGPRSWQLRTAMVFLSPQGLNALRQRK